MDRDNLRAKGLVLLIFVAAVAISFIVSNRRNSAIMDAVDEALEDRNYTDDEYHALYERKEEYETAIYSTQDYSVILSDYFEETEGIPQEVYDAWESYDRLISQFY